MPKASSRSPEVSSPAMGAVCLPVSGMAARSSRHRMARNALPSGASAEAPADPEAAAEIAIRASMTAHEVYARQIAIAHRLHTIIAFDRIVVMSEGRVAETGVPSELLNRTEGPFATMTAALGPAAKEELRELAGRRKRASFSDDGLDDDASD